MARLPQGPLGSIHGKLGPVVGSSWMGEPYVKSTGKKRTKKRGKIEKHNQGNFALLHRWLQPLLPFLKQGFKNYAPRVFGFNAAKSYALKNAFVGVAGAKEFDPSKVQVSYGDLPLPTHMHFEKQENVIHFFWDKSVPQEASAYDQAMLLVYNSDKGTCSYQLTGQFRETGEDKLQVPPGAGPCHIYIAFTSHDRSRQSHSVYLGMVENEGLKSTASRKSTK